MQITQLAMNQFDADGSPLSNEAAISGPTAAMTGTGMKERP